MDQKERRLFLIKTLLSERPQYRGLEIPEEDMGQRRLLRSLLNVRMPEPVCDEFLEVQDAYLQEELAGRGITRASDLIPVQEGMYLWKGDITTLACDAIVNAANSQLLGCFCPCHGCIDNAIHTFAGVQLRAACQELMRAQGHEEAAGGAKITPAYNLPCRYILHTVGPIVRGRLTKRDQELLAACYRSCLELAEKNGIKSLAFCCISTGEFHFPNDKAAQIAVRTVKEYRQKTNSHMEVIFNVFKEEDFQIYRKLLRAD
ncbi:MAG: protein-ADP-ribose hydrolase [Clostridiales bacterium]|nr:protein-ADP-ribose hydrolase [Clostridiales bacterium]